MGSPRIVFDDDDDLQSGASRRLRIPRLWLVVGSLTLLLLVILGLYQLAQITGAGQWTSILTERSRLVLERESLSEANVRLRRENAQLREELVFQRESGQIDAMADSTVYQQLSLLQDELSEAREQVAFYRSIVSPEDALAGVRVHSLQIWPTASDRIYSYRLTLIQAVRHDRDAVGTVELDITGLLDGAPKTLTWETVQIAESNARGPRRYKFKYFQELAGELALPSGFEATRVQVAVDPKGRRQPAVESSYGWVESLR